MARKVKVALAARRRLRLLPRRMITSTPIDLQTDSIYAILSDRDMQQKIARPGQGTRSAQIKAIVSEVLERLGGE